MRVRRPLLFAAFAAVVLFLLVAGWVLAGESMPLDLAIRDAVHSRASPLATGVLFTITMLGMEWVMLPLGAIIVWRLATTRRARLAILLAVGGISAEAASELLKLAFQRPRPPVYFGLAPAATYSFPSGHAFVATVFYGLMAAILLSVRPNWRRLVVTVSAITALLIGFSRVYLGYHYPTDVLGGWLCAAAWLAMARIWWVSAG